MRPQNEAIQVAENPLGKDEPTQRNVGPSHHQRAKLDYVNYLSNALVFYDNHPS